MVNNVVNATYTETYDLNTALGELSLLGVHTPQSVALKKMFKGFFENYKKFKIISCDIAMVCATQQSLTPDQVGIEESAGLVDPRDILNPILFKACTGESLNVLLNQIYNRSEEVNTGDELDSSSIAQHVDTRDEALGSYYTLLSDDSFRKEHPQRGLVVTGLRPMVHRVVTTQPFKWNGTSSTIVPEGVPAIGGYGTGAGPDDIGAPPCGFGAPSGTNNPVNGFDPQNPNVFVSNGLTDMPWLDTTFDATEPGIESATPYTATINNVPRVYVGCIVLPPALLQRLFFRMRIRWHIAFRDFRPAYEVGRFMGNSQYLGNGTVGMPSTIGSYFNIYHSPITLNQSMSSFDANGVSEVTDVMEQAS